MFLGWTTTDYSHAGGTVLYRLSHPDGDPQFYTRHEVSATPDPADCADVPQGDFIYSKDVVGGTGVGSSGSPVYLEDLRVVGQELGSCGFEHRRTTATSSRTRRSTGPFASRFRPCRPGSIPSGPCIADADDALPERRPVPRRVAWTTPNGDSGPGMGVALTGDSGYFWFFNAANIELVVKVLDACAIVAGHSGSSPAA